MYVYSADDFSSSVHASTELITVLGNFDGVHIGHAALLRAATEERERRPGALVAVRTFFAHPRPDCRRLTSNSEREALLSAHGVDILIYDDFEHLRDMSPERFVRDVLCRMNTVCCVCGYNYRFGRGASGDAEQLERLLRDKGITLITVEKVTHHGDTVSSTRIRGELEKGNIEEANALLGHTFGITAEVVHGRHLGSEFGFPTANQSLPHELDYLPHGVYASVFEIDGARYPAVTNIGVRPTVGGDERVFCESHILGYKGDLYSKLCRLELVSFMRRERRFENTDELKSAVFGDIRDAERVLGDISDNKSLF